jgi:hypothetical protein
MFSHIKENHILLFIRVSETELHAVKRNLSLFMKVYTVDLFNF